MCRYGVLNVGPVRRTGALSAHRRVVNVNLPVAVSGYACIMTFPTDTATPVTVTSRVTVSAIAAS